LKVYTRGGYEEEEDADYAGADESVGGICDV